MKKVKLINVRGVHIDNATGQPVEISFEESSFDTISGAGKYTFVLLYTCLATFCGKTLKSIWPNIDEFAAETNNYDFNAIVVK